MKKWKKTDDWEVAFNNYNDNMEEVEQGFDNRYTKQEVDTSLDLKADKQQEEWITPTLLNGATTDPNHPLMFMKDEFGVVHMRGFVSNTNAASVAFNMPKGYLPNGNSASGITYLSIRDGLSFGSAGFSHAGGVYVVGALENVRSFYGVNFKAVN